MCFCPTDGVREAHGERHLEHPGEFGRGGRVGQQGLHGQEQRQLLDVAAQAEFESNIEAKLNAVLSYFRFSA